jgi:hypothetical protein
MSIPAHFDGRVFVPDHPTMLPIGRKVRVELEPLEFIDDDPDPPGTEGDPQHSDPDSIAGWIEEMRSIPAIVLTADEESGWHDYRARQQQMHEARMNELAERFGATDS